MRVVEESEGEGEEARGERGAQSVQSRGKQRRQRKQQHSSNHMRYKEPRYKQLCHEKDKTE